jgi:hypothetical protein
MDPAPLDMNLEGSASDLFATGALHRGNSGRLGLRLDFRDEDLFLHSIL